MEVLEIKDPTIILQQVRKLCNKNNIILFLRMYIGRQIYGIAQFHKVESDMAMLKKLYNGYAITVKRQR